MKPKYRINDLEYEVSPVRNGGALTLEIDGRQHLVSLSGNENPRLLTIDGKSYEVFTAAAEDQIYLRLNNHDYQLSAIDPIAAAASDKKGTDTMIAPMPGVVVSLAISAGDEVKAGQILLTIESMKLQTAIIAERDGVIAVIGFKETETFDKGAVLIRFEDQDS
ncbi:MAG: biotin/lipoyl-containing protein [Gammaproteobacteria bacterium]